MNKKQHIWKWMFLSLFVVNVVGVITLFAFVFLMGDGTREDIYEETIDTSFQPIMSLQFTPQQLDSFLQEEWQHEQVHIHFGNGTIQTEIFMEMLGQTTTATLEFIPEVLTDGNIRLVETSFSIGGLRIPASTALNMIASQVDIPSYVEIFPENRIIVVKLNEITFKEKYYLKAEKIDLEEGIIELLLGK